MCQPSYSHRLLRSFREKSKKEVPIYLHKDGEGRSLPKDIMLHTQPELCMPGEQSMLPESSDSPHAEADLS